MANKSKKLKGLDKAQGKRIATVPVSTDNEKMIWVFDSVDVDGFFRFDPHREDFDAEGVFDKLLNFSKKTWSELRYETHGKENKSKHHFLTDAELSKEAEERIAKLHLEDDRDRIYSVRLEAVTRIIGLRDGEKFIVKWYDPKHQFCPSSKD